MTPKIKQIQYKGEYIYYILFEDNREGDINFQSFLWGKAFEPLKDKNFFQKAFIDRIAGVITWPNGTDIARETLYEKLNTQKISKNH